MTYKVKLSSRAQKQLRKLDKHTASLIIKYLYKNIEGSNNPRAKGKGLTANRSGEWRYRVGDYRIICDINDDQLVVLAITIGHRRDIY